MVARSSGTEDFQRQATPAQAEGESQKLLEGLVDAVDPERPVAIYTHDQPDPDSIASAYALEYLLSKRLGIDSRLAYGGTIGRAMNHVMVDLLGIPLRPLSDIRFDEIGTHCLIDTQPRAGNHSLPDDLPVAIAIDHHPVRPESGELPFGDVRTEYGATSTMMFYYLKAAGLDLPTKLATALMIGIKSDTRSLERETSEADLHAYLEIFPRADLTLLNRIENPTIPQRYFQAFHQALEESVIYGRAIITDLGSVEHPDLVAELADFFSPLDRADFSLVMGRHGNRLYVSLRSRDGEHDAGALIARVVGDLGTAGGHGRIAGAQIDLDDGEPACGDLVRRRFLEALEIDPELSGEALVSSRAE